MAAKITITGVHDVGDDVLHVTAEAGDETYEATGWVSATTHHFDAKHYGKDGHLVERAKPRAMKQAEVGEYALRLLLEQNPDLASAKAKPKPKPVKFTHP